MSSSPSNSRSLKVASAEGAVLRLAADLQVGLRIDELRDAFPQQRMVVHQQDPFSRFVSFAGHGCTSFQASASPGNTQRMIVPRSAPRRIASLASTVCAR